MKKVKTLKYLLVTSSIIRPFILIARETLRRIFSFETVSIFQYDLSKPFKIPIPLIPTTIRELQNKDIDLILPLNESGINLYELRTRIERFLLIKAQIPNCYVASTIEDQPCAICWLIDHTSNELLNRHYDGGIFELKENEVLCEGIYVHSAYRKKKLMQYLTFKLFQAAVNKEAKTAFAFIDDRNIVSIQGSKTIGWKKVGTKQIKWILFKRSLTFKMFNSQKS